MELLGVFLLVILSSITYWKTLEFGFVHDDIVAIIRNPDVIGPFWTNLWWNDYWGTPMSSKLSHKSYRPITVLTFRFNYLMSRSEVNGGGALSGFWFHLTNIGIHVLVTVVLFLIGRYRLYMNLPMALTTSVFFALHPIHTEAVGGLAGRSDALACLLMLISFFIYSNGSHGRMELTPRAVIGGFVGWVAMLAKETGLTVLGINAFYDLCFLFLNLKKWMNIGRGDDRMKRKGIIFQINPTKKLSFIFIMTIVGLIVRVFVLNGGSLPQFSIEDNPASHSDSQLTRFLTFAFLPVFNVWLLLYPSHLSYDWQMGSIPLVTSLLDSRNLPTITFYPILIFGILYTLFKSKKDIWSCQRVVFGFLFLILPFLPASNLFFPIGFVVAERVLYIPSVGLSILFGSGFHLLRNHFKGPGLYYRVWRVLLNICLGILLVSFCLKSLSRNSVWRSRVTLFEAGLEENPANAKIHYNYGNLQKDLGNIELALKHYHEALRLWPNYASAHNNLGVLSSSEMDLGESSFLSAIESNPLHNGAHLNLALIYMGNGRYGRAVYHLERLISHQPNNSIQIHHIYFHQFINQIENHLYVSKYSLWTSHQQRIKLPLSNKLLIELENEPDVIYNVALSLVQMGMWTEAGHMFQRLDGLSASYNIQYAQFLVDNGNWTGAEEVLGEILRRFPTEPTSRLLLANIYDHQNRSREAFESLQNSSTLFCPGELCSVFYSQLGNIMHSTGAFQSAAHYYKEAIKVNPDSVQAHANMGALYHLWGKYNEAEGHYKCALGIDPSNSVIQENIQKLNRLQNSQHRK